MVQRTLQIVIAAAVVIFTTSSVRLAAQVIPSGESTGFWFVELDTSVNTFRARAKAAGLTFTEHYVYQRLWRGLSISAPGDTVAALARVPGVRAVFPVLTAELAPTEEASPQLAFALSMTGATIAQETLGLTGQGIKVAVMDSGIDYHHPDLGGGFGPGSRVVTGYDFVGDRFNSSGSGGALIPHPDGDPDDCDGHGTHVAGIVGASGNPNAGGARGVAPGVSFGAYRVFGCEGTTRADIMLAAMERALADGMDVLNMSIVSGFQNWPQYPTAVAADNLVNAGMVVVAAIGNNGGNGVFSAGAPGVGRKVIGVASFDNSHLLLPSFTVSPDATPVAYFQGVGAPSAPTTGTAALARTGTPSSTTDACAPLPAGSLTGKVALIRRGTCTFYQKTINAQTAGATGVVIYNNVAGFLAPGVTPPSGSPPVGIPVVGITAADGLLIDSRIAAGDTTLTWTDEQTAVPNPTGGRSSPFTSWGLTAELGLKPNIGAPGGFIRSTLPLELDGYGTLSGTSMASPHVAGAVALYLDAHPDAAPADVLTAFQNSADPVPFGSSFVDPVHRQGGGMIDIDDAIVATTKVTPSELSVGEDADPKTFTLTIANDSAADITYTVGHAAALSTLGTFVPGVFTVAASPAFSAPAVLVPAGGTGTVDVTFTPPPFTAFNTGVYGGSIVISGGGRTYRVPYAGMKGDYQAIQVLAPGGCPQSPFPGIFKRGGQTVCVPATPTAPAVLLAGSFTRQTGGATYNVEDRNDRPVVLFHLAHQSRRLEVRAVDVATGESYDVALTEFVIRNPTNGVDGFFTFTWDGKRLFTNPVGQTRRQELPNGVYKLELVVTKALAQEGIAAHIETWTSPEMVITRVP